MTPPKPETLAGKLKIALQSTYDDLLGGDYQRPAYNCVIEQFTKTAVQVASTHESQHIKALVEALKRIAETELYVESGGGGAGSENIKFNQPLPPVKMKIRNQFAEIAQKALSQLPEEYR